MRVYISGPITGLPIDVARKTFADAAADLVALGYEAVNPCELPTDPGCACPNAAGAAGTGSNHLWACYLRKDIRALVDCDAILMLPGWETSHGARLELTVASAVGLRVWWRTPRIGVTRPIDLADPVITVTVRHNTPSPDFKVARSQLRSGYEEIDRG